MKKLCVAVSDDGQIMVGEEPPGEDEMEGEDQSYLQPVDSQGAMDAVTAFIADADGAGKQAEAQANDEFEGGFEGVGPMMRGGM